MFDTKDSKEEAKEGLKECQAYYENRTMRKFLQLL